MTINGTDEHGTKIQQAAAQTVPVAQYCEYISAQYRHVFAEASIANTDFIRTTEERHKTAVAHFWHTLKSRGHIYSAAYCGWYCVSDETFLTESQLRLDTHTGAGLLLDSGHPAAKLYTIEGLRYFLLREVVAHSDGNHDPFRNSIGQVRGKRQALRRRLPALR
ncbi:methionine--tRNA ligase, mitochondrial-like isoform X3 [Eurosta solidaginis]|uniref:methionine--tRNA ligase, mitochondrial-like isoform X3 n=1 Tax=Eurosta solidaginis TaxID=178769 RepID=UPI0035311FB1